MGMDTKIVEANDTYKIRQAVLRQGLPIDTCYFEGDKDELTFHLVGHADGKLVSVASFYFTNHKLFEPNHPYQFQLRGMATLEEFQGQGFSQDLLKTAFPMIKKNQCDLLWCNAHTSAQGFYEKVGFESHGDIFEIEGVGPHILMSKKI